MKKILHIVDSLERGGQETFLLDLAITQQKLAFQVQIVCLVNEGVLVAKARKYNISVICFKTLTSKGQKISALSSVIEEYKPDIIHTHNRAPLFITLLAKPSYANKIINTRHGNGVRGLYWSIAALFIKKIVNVSEDLYLQSNWFNRVCLKFKNIVIKNGILIDDSIAIENNVGRIIIVGRLNPVKNHILALKITKECILQKLSVTLQVVGDGIEKTSIQKLVEKMDLQDNVELLGDRSDVKSLLLKADIFLLTSFSEGHSIALLEACSAGLPAIVSNVGGNGEIIQDGITGYVRELDDIAGFVNCIKKLILDRNLRKSMSKETRKWAVNNASMDSCTREYLKVYSN